MSMIKRKRDDKGKINKGWENLKEGMILLNDRDPEEAKAIRSKGGKASAENKKTRKLLKEALHDLINHEVSDQATIEKVKKLYPDVDANEFVVTYKEIIMSGLIQKAIRNDAVGNKAIEILIDLLGEKQPIKQEITGANGSAFIPPVINTYFVKSKDEIPE